MSRITLPKRRVKKHQPEIVTGNFQLHYEELIRKNRYMVIALLGFGITGLSAIIPLATYRSIAISSFVSIEAESGSISDTTKVLKTTGDSAASGGSYVKFTAGSSTGGSTPGSGGTPPATTTTRPTRDNTGPRYTLTNMSADDFYNTRSCNRQRINEDVNFTQQWMKGQTFNLTDCEITGKIYIAIDGGGATLSLNDMPIINMDYVDVNSGIITLNAAKLTANHSYFAGSQIVLKDFWAPFVSAPAPFIFSNSMFYGLYASQPTHTEALHIADYGSGYRFTNVAFVQQGGALANSGVTAAINFHGSDTVFDGCWFVWDGHTPAYYAAYIDGINTVVKNSWFQKGAGNYIYPDSSNNATYQNNKDFMSGEAVSFP